MADSNTYCADTARYPVDDVDKMQRLKPIFSGSIGNMLEYCHWYVTACILVSPSCYLLMPDTRRTSRIDQD